MKGLVYFIMSKNNADIKIGYDTSESGIERFNALKTGASRGLEYLAYIKSDSCEMLEKDLHEKFKPKRLNGEWFEIGMQDVVSVVNEYGGKFGMPAELNLPDTESKEKLRQYKKAKARFLRMLPYRFSLSEIELFGQPYYYKNFGLTLSQAKDIIEKNLVARKEGRSVVICNDKNDIWQKSLNWPLGRTNPTENMDTKTFKGLKSSVFFDLLGKRHENFYMIRDLYDFESKLMQNNFFYEMYLKNLYEIIQQKSIFEENILFSKIIEDAFFKTKKRFEKYFDLTNQAELSYQYTTSSDGITGRNYDVLIKNIVIFRKKRHFALLEAKSIIQELNGLDSKFFHDTITDFFISILQKTETESTFTHLKQYVFYNYIQNVKNYFESEKRLPKFNLDTCTWE